MNPEFEQELNRKLAAFDAWANESTFRECKLVQYCGVDLVGVIDVETDQIVDQITGLLCEGFYVDWKQNGSILYLRVYEFGGPEPTWEQVVNEEPLADIDAILKDTGFRE
jgi:hypothetical protein|uniref:Uncharacterized protein n=1 Tax=Shewanella putrefaciens (strain 200) TaxID=399804 RepID=E6XJ27_SHEP2